jgi:hypothetical protein
MAGDAFDGTIIDVAPGAIGVGGWSELVEHDGEPAVAFGVLLRLFLPEGVNLRFEGDEDARVHLDGDGLVNVRLGPAAAAEVAAKLLEQLARS